MSTAILTPRAPASASSWNGYMRYLCSVDWSKPHNWDLAINTGSFSVEETVALVAAMVHGGMLEPSVLDRQRLANLALASRVEAALFCDRTEWVSCLSVVAQ